MAKDTWTYTLTRLDKRYPNIKREFPKAKYMDVAGNKFKDLKSARRYRKRQQDYKRRVNKPKIKIRIA